MILCVAVFILCIVGFEQYDCFIICLYSMICFTNIVNKQHIFYLRPIIQTTLSVFVTQTAYFVLIIQTAESVFCDSNRIILYYYSNSRICSPDTNNMIFYYNSNRICSCYSSIKVCFCH